MFEACMKFACVLTIRLMGGDSLQSPNGSMKTRSLMKEVLVVEASKLSPNFPEKKMLEAELLNQLRKSSKFVVEGKVVRLAKPLQQGV
jgi:hypothetical protein